MNNKKNIWIPYISLKKSTDKGCYLILLFWFCGGLLYVLPNHGGTGLELPQNILAWCVVSLLALWCFYGSFQTSLYYRYSLPSGTWLIILGGIFWSLPLIWTPDHDWFLNAIPRVMGLWGMIGLYMLMLLTTSGRGMRKPVLLILVCASVLQCGYAVWQLIHHNVIMNGRPGGSFEQVNVLSSFLATGTVAAAWQYLQCHHKKGRILSGLVLFGLSAFLVILQSRAGLVGVILAMVLLVITSMRTRKVRAAEILWITGGGLLTGWLLLFYGSQLHTTWFPALLNKEHSTHARLRMILTTWEIIKQHPVTGSGYGGFESLFGEYASRIPNPNHVNIEIVSHPHNEMLFAWAEGGICAVTGLGLIITGCLRRLWCRGGIRLTGVALLIPLIVHANLEYPLYVSVSHGLLLVIILVISGPGCKMSVNQGELPSDVHFIWQWAGVIICSTALIFMITGIETQQKLNKIESQGLVPLFQENSGGDNSFINSYVLFDRIEFDRHVALLLRYNITKSPYLLDNYKEWGEKYLKTHNDPSVFASLLTIYKMQSLSGYTTLCQRANRRWPADPRFDCIR